MLPGASSLVAEVGIPGRYKKWACECWKGSCLVKKPRAGLLWARLLTVFAATKPLCDPGTIIHAATGGHEWRVPYFLNYLQA